MSNMTAVEPEFDIAKDRLIRPPEIRRILGVSRSTFERWIKSGYFPEPNFFIAGPAWTEFRFKAFLKKCVEDSKNHSSKRKRK